MSRPLDIEVSELAAIQILAADDWWRLNRPKAPNAIHEELDAQRGSFHFNLKLVRAPATLLSPVSVACIWRGFVTISTSESSPNLSASRC